MNQSPLYTCGAMTEFPSQAEILRVFEQHPHKTFRLRELVVEFRLRSSEARLLKQALHDLARQRKILELKKSHFALPRIASAARHEPTPERRAAAGAGRRNVATGRLIGHRDGYGFVVPEHPVAGTDQDIFIPPGGM
jgi:Ribonuclease B OB domain